MDRLFLEQGTSQVALKRQVELQVVVIRFLEFINSSIL